jgi:mannan endo-1,4-beta-mannosidase
MENEIHLSRRRLLELAGVTGASGLAGCGGRSGGRTESETAPATSATDSPTDASNDSPTATEAAARLDFNELRYPAKVIEGERFRVRLEVVNLGEAAVDPTVRLVIGDVATSAAISLDAGDAVRLALEVDGGLSPGSYTLSVAGPADGDEVTGELAVEERASLLDRYVGVDGPAFELDGEPFAMNGGNNDMLGRAPRWYVDRVFEAAAELGFTALRTWAYAGRCFIGSCAGEGATVLPQPDELDGPVDELPPLNEVVLERLDYAIYKANETGVRLVLPMLSNTESHTGIGDFVKYSATAEDHDDFYTDETCRRLFEQYATALLTRENTITGREYRDDPGILMWELVNEPDLLDNEGATSIMQGWFEEMAPFVKSVDDNHLLSTGEIGFYEDDRPQSLAGKNDQGMDYIANHEPAAIDAATFHLYLNKSGLTEVENGTPRWKTWVENHARDAHDHLEKPVYAGEFAPGDSDGDYLVDRRDDDWKTQDERRAEKYRELYEVFAETGVNGALNWTFMIPFDFATDPVDDPDQWNTSVSVYPDDPHTPEVIQEYTSTLGSNN